MIARMSLRNLLRMRCDVQRVTDVQIDGLVKQSWSVVESNQRCFLDLNFIRAGKDPVWVPDSGTAQNRSGVLFIAPETQARPGDRIHMILGPTGTFEISSAMDEAWTPKKLHHLECFVIEVNRMYTGGNNA